MKVRENLKHAKSKAKKLEKQLQKDKEKVVGWVSWTGLEECSYLWEKMEKAPIATKKVEKWGLNCFNQMF